jgi:hypothetical protein
MAAIAVSMILHMLILYVHPLAVMFSVCISSVLEQFHNNGLIGKNL